MRGILTVLAVATLLLAVLPSISALTTPAYTANQTYQLGNRTLTIFPVSINGTTYLENGLLRIWKKSECEESGAIRSCLTTPTSTSATFTETASIAIVKGTHRITQTTARVGEDIEGELVLTNTGDAAATDVTVTFRTRENTVFSDGTRVRTVTGTISRDSEWTPTYRITGISNGTTSVSVEISYYDANATKKGTITNTTATWTLPFTSVLAQSVMNTSERTWVSLNVTKVSTNITITTLVTLPPEAVIHNYSRALSLSETTLRDREFLNSTTTKASYNFTYSLSAPPSAPLTVTYTYEEPDYSQRTLVRTYPFTITNESKPIIGFTTTNIPINKEGSFSITLIGTTTGRLVIRSNLINETVPATPNTYYFTTPATSRGEYPVAVRFEWEDAYGRELSVNGSLVLIVTDAPHPLANSTTNSPASVTSANATNKTITSGITTPSTDTRVTVTLTEPDKVRRDALTWTLGGVVIGALLSLLWLLHRVRDPLDRVEGLLRRTIELRTALMHKRGGMTAEERTMLAELETQLDDLKRTLR